MDPVTCHILDTTIGKPATNVTVQLFYIAPFLSFAEDERAYELPYNNEPFAMSKTDADGRIKNWTINPSFTSAQKARIGITSSWSELKPGIYKCMFLTGSYFHRQGDTVATRTFFPYVEITFEIGNPPDSHYHIPLLLSNHSFTTYRGS